jgi:protein-tyrosine phosphatase
MKILMVCLGNICRSPLAEGLLRAKAKKQHINLTVDSAGTSAFRPGGPPDKRSIEVARAHGIDIQHQQCRQFTSKDFEAFDFIYVMDASNYEDVIAQAQKTSDKQKVQLILQSANSGAHQNVPDPYYGGEDGFEKMYQLLDGACDAIVEHLIKGGLDHTL